MLPATSPRSIPRAPSTQATLDPLKNLRLLIYLYVGLWVFEGALRKWILPGLSGPLLIIRDPVVVAIYIEAMRQKVFRFDGFTGSMLILSILATVISLGLPQSPLPQIIIFGFRANFLHLPLIFLIPRVLEYRHVRFIGAAILWVATPIALLAALQYISPSVSRLNAGAGGGENGMLETARGHIRPSGPFSFTNGMAGYSGLVGAFLLHQLLERNIFPKVAVFAAFPALLVMVVVSGSRTTVGIVVLLLLAVLVIWIVKPRYMQSSIKFFAIGFVAVLIVGSFSVLKEGISTLTDRFGDKKNVQSGFVMRFVDEFTKPIDTVARAETFGVGIGMGTNAASSMMYGKVRFTLGESDYDRVIMEMGPLLGLSYIAWRILAALVIGRQSIFALRRDGNTLPLLLLTACLADLLQGQFGQSTTLGFVCMTAGLALAGTRRNEPEVIVETEAITAPTQRIKLGRSTYAAQLMGDIPEVAEEILVTPLPDSATTVLPKPGRKRKIVVPSDEISESKSKPSRKAAPTKQPVPKRKTKVTSSSSR